MSDLEYLLTKRVWEDSDFAAEVERDPAAALASLGAELPAGVKVKIVVQRRDTLYFTIPPARLAQSDAQPINQIDLWSSAGSFVWLIPAALKTALLQLRQSVRARS